MVNPKSTTLLWWPLWIGLAVMAHRKPWLGRLYLALAIPLAAIWAAGFFTSVPLTQIFGTVAAVTIGASIVMFLLVRPVRRMMGGVL